MKIPRQPPSTDGAMSRLMNDPVRFQAVLDQSFGPSVNGRYVHWDKLRFLTPPQGMNHEDWWLALKLRRGARNLVPMTDSESRPFGFNLVDPLPECLHYVDSKARGNIGAPAVITNEETRDQYVVRSLIEESLTSSQLEGAIATRDQAKKIIREGRIPTNNSEQMVLNNYRTMQRIRKIKDQELSKETIFDLQRIATESTLDDSTGPGRFRRSDEEIVVSDEYGVEIHKPPSAQTLDRRMEMMCEFANGKIPGGFLHPMIRSIILHFWLAYDHPFIDGNGRTARALFYWSMLHHGYWLFEFVSISRIILNAPSKYGRAFLYTETDDNDLTYFLLYHASVIRRSVAELDQDLDRRARQLQKAESELRGLLDLNPRQKELVSRVLKHPGETYSIQGHQVSHNVVYQTARVDLQTLVDRGFLERFQQGKAFRFRAVPDLEQRLKG